MSDKVRTDGSSENLTQTRLVGETCLPSDNAALLTARRRTLTDHHDAVTLQSGPRRRRHQHSLCDQHCALFLFLYVFVCVLAFCFLLFAAGSHPVGVLASLPPNVVRSMAGGARRVEAWRD